MSISEIALKYDVSRSSVHTYRRGGTFPRPAPVEGMEKTKLRFRADEVAAWFKANPKSQGKRTDLPAKQQGEPEVTEVQSPALLPEDYEAREKLLDAAVLIEQRWPGEHPTLCRDLRDLGDKIGEESDA